MPYIENSDNPIADLSFNFGVRIVKFYKYLASRNVYVLSKQILRCGTSIGANVQESIHAQSKADFISKMNIALKGLTKPSIGYDCLESLILLMIPSSSRS